MNRILIIISAIFMLPGFLYGQETRPSKPYWRSGSEFIFSMGAVTVDSGSVDPVMRFSGFFHFQQQLHINFGKYTGMYTGVGMRNVGMINDLNDTIKIKQRVYSLAIPLAFKIGRLPAGSNVALGGEAEFFFHYKQKAFYDDEKFRKSEWFSKKVNMLNPSVFLEFHARQGSYIRIKYYLLDFLVTNKQDVKIHGIKYDYRPESSKLFYVSIGTTIKHKPSSRAKKSPPPVNTAFYF